MKWICACALRQQGTGGDEPFELHRVSSRSCLDLGKPGVDPGARCRGRCKPWPMSLAHVIREDLCRPRDKAKITADVIDMRRLMLKENAPYGIWDVKRTQGGLIDIEFIAQYLQIAHAHDAPEILHPTTYRALEKLIAARLLARGGGSCAEGRLLLYQRLTQVLRLCVSGPYDPKRVPSGLNRIVASATWRPRYRSRARSALALAGYANPSGDCVFAVIVGPLGKYIEAKTLATENTSVPSSFQGSQFQPQ